MSPAPGSQELPVGPPEGAGRRNEEALSTEALIHTAPAETCQFHGCGGGTWPNQAP